MCFGILADEVLGVDEVQMNSLEPPLPGGSSQRELYTRGIAHGALVVLDAQKIRLPDLGENRMGPVSHFTNGDPRFSRAAGGPICW